MVMLGKTDGVIEAGETRKVHEGIDAQPVGLDPAVTDSVTTAEVALSRPRLTSPALISRTSSSPWPASPRPWRLPRSWRCSTLGARPSWCASPVPS